MTKKITVIVTAYNRTNYLDNALHSLDRQTLAKNLFDVVLVTNFEFNLERYANLRIKHIITEGKDGEFVEKALLLTNSEIICFLDDDDYYLNMKLERVLSNFGSRFIYYRHRKMDFLDKSEIQHNRELNRASRGTITEIRSDSKKPKTLRALKMGMNNSTICVKKEVLTSNLSFISKIPCCIDEALFLLFSYLPGDGLFDSSALSMYRNTKRDIRASIITETKALDFYNHALTYLEGPLISQYVHFQIVKTRFKLFLLTNRETYFPVTNDLTTCFHAALTGLDGINTKITFLQMLTKVHFYRLSLVIDRLLVKIVLIFRKIQKVL